MKLSDLFEATMDSGPIRVADSTQNQKFWKALLNGKFEVRVGHDEKTKETLYFFLNNSELKHAEDLLGKV